MSLLRRFANLFRDHKLDRDLDDELRSHMEMRAEENMAEGMSPDDARADAARRFGNRALLKETARSQDTLNWLETVLQDLRYSFRVMRKNLGFSIVAVLTLALGIGANTAIFSLVNTVLVRSLPYRDPDRLVKIVNSNPGVGLRDIGMSVTEMDDLKLRAGVFDDLSVTWPVSVNLTGAEHPERLEMVGVSPNYFSMLGATPQIGRLFGPQDESEGFAEAIVISDKLWQQSYGRDPGVLGKRVRLDNDPYTIVGVLPPEFRHPGKTLATDVDLWASAGYRADPFPKPARNQRFLPGVIGHLKPGLSRAQAQAKLDALASALRSEYPTDYPAKARWSIEIEPLQESLVGKVRPMLLVLMGAVMLIILIASVNMANLLLARASGRQKEIAVRLSLGASRTRIVRQMLTESMVLSFTAGVAGIVTARLTLPLVLRLVPAQVPRLTEVSVDWVVLGFALLVSTFTGIAFGLAPAVQSVKADLLASVREGASRSGTSAKTNRLRSLLIVSELALSVVLMVGAGLLLRTLWGLLQENPGFNPSRVVTAGIWLPVPNDPKADPYAKGEVRNNFVRESLRRVNVLPGIELAALATDLPVTAGAFHTVFAVEDRPDESAQDLSAELTSVSTDYFKVMQVPLVHGRFFAEDDQPGKQLVAIVDETTAHRFWPAQDAIGRRLKFSRTRNPVPWISVVGVISDIKNDGLDKNGVPHIYVPIYQSPSRVLNVVARTNLPASLLEPQIRHEIQAVDPGLPVFGVRAMNEVVDASLAPRRFSAELVGVFALLALLLASVGIYGLLAYMVSQRSQEIGIRMALGARPANIRKMILGQGVVLAGIGVVVGVLLAAITAPAISSLLYGVRALDPIVFLTVPLFLIATALLASYIPAHRATRVDPMIALRHE